MEPRRSRAGADPAGGQRPDSRARRGRRSRHPAGVAARQRADRLQGGLRRGRVRRLRGAGGPRRRAGPRPAGSRSTPAWCRPRRSTSRRSSPRRAWASPGAAAPGPARDGRPRRLAVRLLHAGLHLLDGRRVLPAGPAAGGHRRPGHGPNGSGTAPPPTASARPGTHADHEHGPNGFDLHALQRQPVPVHRLPADQGRGLRPGPARGGRPVPGPAGRARAGARRHHDLEHAGPLRPPGRAWPRRSSCWPPTRTPSWWPGPPTGASS